jgi:hypothetical protein
MSSLKPKAEGNTNPAIFRSAAHKPTEDPLPEEYLTRPLEEFPALAASTRNVLQDRLKARAMDRCHEEASAFVECTRDKYFSVLWSCRPKLRGLNACLKEQFACWTWYT